MTEVAKLLLTKLAATAAEQQGPGLLGNVGVSEAISDALKARSERTLIIADRVLEELAKIGFADIRKAINGVRGSRSPMRLAKCVSPTASR